MFGLMGVNWALESYKWQIALKPVQPIRFLRAFKAILAGTCIASFTPNRVGEYLGRMLFVDPGNKILSIAPTILCSMSQMLVTLAAGTVGIYLFSSLPYYFDAAWITPAFFKAAGHDCTAGALGLGLVYFRFDPWSDGSTNGSKKITTHFQYRKIFSFPALARILFISVIRYGVFLLQYYLLFSLFDIPLLPHAGIYGR